jgi:hypothetical protein
VDLGLDYPGREGNFACLSDCQTHQIQQVGEGIGLHNFRVSPDGRYVAYLNSGVLFVHDRQAGQTSRIEKYLNCLWRALAAGGK